MVVNYHQRKLHGNVTEGYDHIFPIGNSGILNLEKKTLIAHLEL